MLALPTLRVRHHFAFLNPSRQDAESGQRFECSLLVPVVAVFMGGESPYAREAAFGEGPEGAVAIADRSIGRVAGDAQVGLARLGFVGRKGLVHEVGVRDVAAA